MINCLISHADNEFVNVYEITDTITNGGSVLKASLKKENLFVSIQSTSSIHNVASLEMVKQIQGKTNSEVKIVYSPRFNMSLGDLIKATDGKIYEVQAIDHKGKGTLLQHDLYFIVLYKNQKILDVKPSNTVQQSSTEVTP